MTELMLAAALCAVLVLSFGLIALLWQAIGALRDQAKLLVEVFGRQQLPAVPVPNIPLPSPPVPLTPKPAPSAPAGPFDAAPAWFKWALHEIGFHETGDNQGIERYISLGLCGAVGDPWCAIFANAALESSHVSGTRSPSSQSFRTNPNFVQLAGPALGAIVVFWRGAQDSGLGHVGFYRGEDANRVWTLGGNENDMVQIEALPKASSSFGLIGYFWPKSAPLPTGGPVIMPSGSPVSVKVAPGGSVQAGVSAAPANGKQAGIVATMFTSQETGNRATAYGGPLDDNALGVALPYHFAGARPRVRLINPKTGVSIEADIVDVGPWNTDDPYWQTGARPQSETGVDIRGRKTNRAGIDLTLAAAKALSIDGKGLVDWEFLQSPLAPETKVI